MDIVNTIVETSLQHMTTLTVSPCLLIYFAQAEDGKSIYFNLNNMFCRNLALSMHYAYQAHRAVGGGAARCQWNHRTQLLLKNCWKSRQNGTETVVAWFSGIGWRTLQHARQAIVSHDRLVYLTQANKTAACSVKKSPAVTDRFMLFRNLVSLRNQGITYAILESTQ